MNAPTVSRGAKVDPAPEISVIVIAIHGDRRAVDAIRSLDDAQVPTEVILVNTGGGSVAEALGPLVEQVVLVECDRLHLPGGARNLGLSQASAPVIAFLAADCLATPGWLVSRLAAHKDAAAVASAIRPAPGSRHVPIASWASYGILHCRRAPECPEDNALRYGVSYRREVFAQYGAFLEDRRIGEDTELNNRLIGADLPHWYPQIVTSPPLPDDRRRGSFRLIQPRKTPVPLGPRQSYSRDAQVSASRGGKRVELLVLRSTRARRDEAGPAYCSAPDHDARRQLCARRGLRGHPAQAAGDGFRYSFAMTRTPSSRSCLGVAGAGAPISRSSACWFIGNSVISRRFCTPQSSITMRSMPNAAPPCGGAPYWNAR